MLPKILHIEVTALPVPKIPQNTTVTSLSVPILNTTHSLQSLFKTTVSSLILYTEEQCSLYQLKTKVCSLYLYQNNYQQSCSKSKTEHQLSAHRRYNHWIIIYSLSRTLNWHHCRFITHNPLYALSCTHAYTNVPAQMHIMQAHTDLMHSPVNTQIIVLASCDTEGYSDAEWPFRISGLTADNRLTWEARLADWCDRQDSQITVHHYPVSQLSDEQSPSTFPTLSPTW